MYLAEDCRVNEQICEREYSLKQITQLKNKGENVKVKLKQLKFYKLWKHIKGSGEYYQDPRRNNKENKNRRTRRLIWGNDRGKEIQEAWGILNK